MTRIQIPRAGVTAGASASVPRPADDGVGRAIADFGERVFDLGVGLEQNRLSRDLARSRVAMADGLAGARLALEAETDPDEIGTAWDARLTELRAETLAAADPRNQETVGLAFDELAARHGLAVGQRALALRREQGQALLTQHEIALSRSPGLTDFATRETLTTQFAETTLDAVERGDIGEEEGLRRIERMRGGLAEAAAIRMLSEDPDALVTAIDGGDFSDLQGADRERFRGRAMAEVKRREEAASRDAERAAVEARRAGEERLSTLASIANSGRVMEGEDAILSDPALQALDGFAEAQAAVELRDELPGFASLPPAEQRAKIEEERAKPIGQRFEDRRLSAMEAAHAATLKAWRTDPIAQAAALGQSVPALPEDLSDPAAWTEAFAARRSFGDGLTERGYTASPAYFSATERAQLKSLVAQGQDATLRAAMAGAIAEGFGTDAPRALRGISDDPVFRHIGGMLAAGAAPGVALKAFRGQASLSAKTVAAPSAQIQQELLNAELGSLMAETFGADDAAQTAILATANAIYAARDDGLSPEDDTSGDAWTQALQEALGGAIDSFGRATGGVREIRDRKTWLPVGVSAEDFEEILDAAAATFEDAEGAVPLAWVEASASGGAPTYGGAQLTAGVAARAKLIAVGDGIYRMVIERRGGEFSVTDSSHGGHYLLRWPALRASIERERREAASRREGRR